MATTVTKRVSGNVSTGTTSRVGDHTEIETIYDAWGVSWGESWGDSWLQHLSPSSAGLTPRVPSTPTASVTKRVSLD